MSAHSPYPLLTLVQEDEQEIVRVLAESGTAECVKIDENRGKSLTVLALSISRAFTLDSRAAGRPRSNPIFKTDLVAPRQQRCGRYRGTWSGGYPRNRSHLEMNCDRVFFRQPLLLLCPYTPISTSVLNVDQYTRRLFPPKSSNPSIKIRWSTLSTFSRTPSEASRTLNSLALPPGLGQSGKGQNSVWTCKGYVGSGLRFTNLTDLNDPRFWLAEYFRREVPRSNPSEQRSGGHHGSYTKHSRRARDHCTR